MSASICSVFTEARSIQLTIFSIHSETTESAGLQSLETSPFWCCLQPLENAYLSRSLSRLFDPVELSFAAPEAIPGTEQLEAMVRAMTSELTFASGHPVLLKKVARNVGKALRLLAAKAEQVSQCSLVRVMR